MAPRSLGALATCALLLLALAPAAVANVAPVNVLPNVQVNQRAPAEVVEDYKSSSVAVNPSNPRNVVVVFRRDSPDYYCHISYSLDGGGSWSEASFPSPPKGTCWAPAVAFDEQGTVYVAAQNRPPGGGDQDIIVWKSSDGGHSFGAPVTVSGPGSFQAGIAVDTHAGSPHRGRIYVTWYRFPNYPVSIDTHLSYSDDGGATWSPSTTRSVAGQYQSFPQPAVGPDGTVYVVFKDVNALVCPGVGVNNAVPGAPRECPIRILRSSNGAQSFDGDPVTVAAARYNDLSAAEQPGIAITPDGAVLVTFAALSEGAAGCANDLDSFVSRSTNRGASWSAPRRINDDPCTGGAAQRDPWVSVAPNGRVDAIFYDNRSGLYDAFYANSSDGGQSFGPNVRASERSFDLTALLTPKASGFQSNEFDQHNGIASTNAGAIAAWGDTRNAPGGSSWSDVFSARIGLGSTGPGAGGAPGGKAGACANEKRGTRRGETINGTPAGDRLLGLGGNDRLNGLQGDDCLLGAKGRDRLSGAEGADRLQGDADADILGGGSGKDRLSGGRGNDKLSGGSGADRLTGGAGRDKLSGGTGSDRLSGGSGRDSLNGGQGRNRLFGGSGNDTINSADGKRETVFCGRGRDTVRADRSDRLRGCDRVLRLRRTR